LEFHQQLSRAIDAEIKGIEQEDDDKAERRAIDFNEILADLPPAARL
jgi:hypothetical protein